MIETNVWISVAVIALVTACLRFLPFLIWNGKRKIPSVIEKFGRLLPYAIMGMLVVYCLRNISLKNMSGFVPELVSCIVVACSYVWKRNTLMSIVLGTVCYMIFVQRIF